MPHDRAYERRIVAVHVSAGPARCWVVRLSGRRQALRRLRLKVTALRLGRQRARQYGVPLIVHARDGTVERIEP